MIRNFYEEMMPVEEVAGSLGIQERIFQAAGPLLGWFEENKRDLPWRQDPSPYHVWLSEIMLQQTRVEAVIPYYYRFLQALPGIKDLAQVEEEALMKLWQGLGYYNRARNLKKAAQVAMDQHGGKLPASYEGLQKMPGIGPYTAGAIGSIAYGLPVPAVDGNVLRVISRLIGSYEDISAASVKKEMEGWIWELLEGHPEFTPSAYNQALMELGALICIPNGAPHCLECPWRGLCMACQKGLTGEIPYKAPKKARKIEEKTVLLIRLDQAGDQSGLAEEMDELAEVKENGVCGRYILNKRPPKGLLAGLYELPNLEGYLDEVKIRAAVEALLKERNLLAGVNCRIGSVESMGQGKHIFTHVEWHMKGYEVRVEVVDCLEEIPGCYSATMIQEEIAIPNAYAKFKKFI